MLINDTDYCEFTYRFWDKVNIKDNDECWIWKGGKQSKGYGSVGIGNGKTALAHRVAYELYSRIRIPKNKCVMHICDCRICCNPHHLKLGTIADNNLDMIAKNRHAVGEKNGRSKLSENQVRRIRRLYRSGRFTQKQLGNMFSVSRSNISRITRGECWKLYERTIFA